MLPAPASLEEPNPSNVKLLELPPEPVSLEKSLYLTELQNIQPTAQTSRFGNLSNWLLKKSS